MNNTKGIFAGKMIVNGASVSDQVHVFIGDQYIQISDTKSGKYPKKSISLHPFSRTMFASYQEKVNITKGITYHASGDNVGAYTYRHTHPPETDVDFWPLKEFSIYVKYNHPQTTFQINGTTTKSIKNSYDKDNSGYPSIRFVIEFQVPRAEIVSLLNGNEYFENILR